MILPILERELTWLGLNVRNAVKSFGRMKGFGKAAPTSVELHGSWDQTILHASDVNTFQEASRLMAFSTTSSKGSYVKDIDGNSLLDMCSTDNHALGHNHESLLKFVPKTTWDKHIINSGLDASHAADQALCSQIKSAFGPVAPSLLQAITLTGGRNATEHAVMHALAQREGGKVLGFSGANHGHSLSMTQFAHPSMSASGLGWPSVAYPQDSGAEARSLEEVRGAVKEQGVKAIIVEPTHWQTGASASDGYIDQLGSIARENGAALIVDETNTCGGASGKGFFQYQGSGADYLTFGKRTIATGYFSKWEDYRAPQVHMGGSPLDVEQFEVVRAQIESLGLIELVDRVGKTLKSQLERVNNSKITGISTSGTMAWIHTGSLADAEALRDHLRRSGVLVRLNGSQGVMTRPALTADEQHVQTLVSALSKF